MDLSRWIRDNAIVAVAAILPVIIIVYYTGTTDFNCNRVKPNQVVCRKERNVFYSLLLQSSVPLRLVDSRLETRTEKPKEESESSDNPKGIYKVYLVTDKGDYLYKSFKNDSQQAQLIKNNIDLYIKGEGNAQFEYIIGDHKDDLVKTLVALALGVLIYGIIGTLVPEDLELE